MVIDLDTPKDDAALPPEQAGAAAGDGAAVLASLYERHGQRWPPATFTVATPRGGTHLYFTAPPGPQLRNTAGRLGPHIDTRAAGGYIVAPASIIVGRAYTVITPAAPQPLPDWLTRQLTQPARPARTCPPGPSTEHAARYARAALHAETRRVARAPRGQRNHTLNRAAFALGQLAAAGLLPAALAHTELTRAARHAGLDRDPGCGPRGIDRTISSGLAAGARKPRRHSMNSPGSKGSARNRHIAPRSSSDDRRNRPCHRHHPEHWTLDTSPDR